MQNFLAKRLSLLSVVCFLLAVHAGHLSAQATAPQSESLLIGAGDNLHVQVFGEPDMEEHTRVSDSGDIRIRLAGTVHVAGLSAGAAASEIEHVLIDKSLFLHPSVSVAIDDFSGKRVTVFGEVKAPGAFVLPTATPLLEVLALAGGLNDAADRKITIERQGTNITSTYFVSNNALDAMKDETRINPGDRVFVPRAGIIYVLGDVHAPGGYAMTNNEGTLTVLQLVARAGGTNPTAAPDHATIIHASGTSYAVQKVKIGKMRDGKQQDQVLEPGDIVYIPFSYLRNLAVNAVGIASTLGSAAIYRF